MFNRNNAPALQTVLDRLGFQCCIKHPVVITETVIPELLAYDGDDGLRGALRALEDRRRWLCVEDEGVLVSIHDPQQMQERLAAAWSPEVPGVVFPTLDGYRKHPPLIDFRLVPELLACDGEGGLRELWRRHKEWIRTVPVDDEGVWVDLDTQTDYRTPSEGVLTGRMLRSRYARARVLDVKVPPLRPGYFYVDRNDVPGDNNVNIVMDDTPVYARETVEYIGEPIGMVVGPDEKEVSRILSEIEVSYEKLEPMLDIRKADTVFFDYEYGRPSGNPAGIPAGCGYCGCSESICLLCQASGHMI